MRHSEFGYLALQNEESIYHKVHKACPEFVEGNTEVNN